jgi:hypothetical protein
LKLVFTTALTPALSPALSPRERVKHLPPFGRWTRHWFSLPLSAFKKAAVETRMIEHFASVVSLSLSLGERENHLSLLGS